MKEEILFQEGPYSIRRFRGIPEAAVQFLDRIAWGNEGAVYEHKNTSEHIPLIPDPMLLAIYEGENVLGTAVFCHTTVMAAEKPFNCYYVRYFAASPEIRGKGITKRFSIKVMELIRAHEQEKTVYFAVIERGNKSSYKVVHSAGYDSIGTIKTMGFSRFFPKDSPHLERMEGVRGKEEVLELLKGHYAPHALVQFDSIGMNDDYYMIREGGEIVAGCQFHRVHWVVNRMEGLSGKLIMSLVPRIPLLNQIFNPKKFEFLAFEGIYCKPGHERQLHELFEALLAREKLKAAMFWMGESCPHRQRIERFGSLGLIHSFVKDSDVTIMASFQHLTAEERESFRHQPLFASAFDYI
jgi:L-amino acid N-acyltransferase YncA